MSKGPILLGGFVAALVLFMQDHHGWALLAACAGIMLTGISRPFRDPVRLFPDEMRRTIWERAEGFCESCGVLTHYESVCPFGGCPADYQCDHVVPWSKGGRTLLANGACLCAKCNAAKGDR